MRKIAGRLLALVGILVVASCSSKEEAARPKILTEVIIPSDVPGSIVEPDAYGWLRTPESVRAYHIGRYIDPATGTMQESTISFRVEESAHWVTDPPRGKYQVPFADLKPYRQPEGRSTELARTEIETMHRQTAELNQAATRRYESVVKAGEELKESQDSIQAALRAGIEQRELAAQYKREMEALAQRNKELQEQLRMLVEERAKPRKTTP